MRTRWLDDEGDPLPPSRITRLDLLILALHAVTSVIGEAARVADGVKTLIQQHNNYLVEREEFSVGVSMAIESLIEEGVEEDG